jgi:hypothetical protein
MIGYSIFNRQFCASDESVLGKNRQITGKSHAELQAGFYKPCQG